MPKTVFKCTASYNGEPYSGWQKQKTDTTVQGTIEYALEKYFGHPVKTSGASRTDAGVHAFGQVFIFTVDTKLEPENIMAIMNDMLPPDIRIINAEKTGKSFHPRHNVRKKLYRYVIFNGRTMYPFYRGRCWHIEKRIDVSKMKEAAGFFRGVKDYYSFSGSGADTKTFEREVEKIRIKKAGNFIMVDFTARSFLYNMIRRMVSVMVSYALGDLSSADIEKLFSSRDRTLIKKIAPGEGLYLVKITYKN